MSLLPELGSWLDVQTDHLHRGNRGKKSRQIFCLLKDLSRQNNQQWAQASSLALQTIQAVVLNEDQLSLVSQMLQGPKLDTAIHFYNEKYLLSYNIRQHNYKASINSSTFLHFNLTVALTIFLKSDHTLIQSSLLSSDTHLK